MHKICSTSSLPRALGLAMALSLISLTARAQDPDTETYAPWVAYPQNGFSSVAITVQPDGAVAYTTGDSPESIRRGDDGATLWSNLPLPEGAYRADAIAAAPDGRVYLTGWRYLSDGVTRAPRVWASSDYGINWQEVGIFLSSSAPVMSVDAGGNVFLSTSQKTGTTPKYPVSRLVTYRGTPDPAAPLGMNWVAVDNFSTANNYAHYANSLTIRPSVDPSQPATIWVAGHGVDSKTLNTYVPVVRRSLDGGASWPSVAPLPVPSGYTFNSGTWRVVAGENANGVAYVCASYGKKVGKTTENAWLTYRSVDHGASWVLVDTLPVGRDYGPDGFTADQSGTVFISGSGRVLAVENGGGKWVSLLPGAHSATADLSGNVFIGGSAVYKLPAP